MPISQFIRRGGLALASLAFAASVSAAEGVVSNADATLKISNTTLKAGDTLSVTFSTTAKHTKLSPCSFEVIVRALDYGNNYMQIGPQVTSMINTDPPQVTTYHLTQAGKYRALAVNPTALPGACGSLPNGTIVSSTLQIDFVVEAPVSQVIGKLPQDGGSSKIQATNVGFSAPGTCPEGYDYLTSGVDTSKGEFYCMKKWQACPAGYKQTVNNNTGQMVCTPEAPPSCPAGWTGGLADGGKLVCNPIPQPKIACPDSPRKSEGYYLQYYKYTNPDWNRMGCVALQNTK
jgi:hypothetical protein